MECSFRIFSQWQDILNLFQLILFHRNQYKWQSCKTYWWNPGWLERHHKNRHHGLALCYNLSKVNIIEVIEIPSVLEVLSIVLEIERETILLVIMYYMPGPLGSFIDDFISLINELPNSTECWLLVILILIKCCLSMLPKLILWFKVLTCLSVHNI